MRKRLTRTHVDLGTAAVFTHDSALSSEAEISQEEFRAIDVGEYIFRLEVTMEDVRLVTSLDGTHELQKRPTEVLVVV